MPKLVTMHGLSRELKMSRESLRRWIDEGVIPLRSRSGSELGVFTEKEVGDLRRAIVARRLGRSLPVSPQVRV
jgi:DNA-binding transcriptional MerR regulator